MPAAPLRQGIPNPLDGGGALLALAHDGFDRGSFTARAARAGLGKGWPRILERLAEQLQGA